MTTKIDQIEGEVIDRYARGAEQVEQELCCPVSDYEAQYMAILPQEIVDKDYGCGNPSKWAQAGDTVVDLGSGAGKICYILSQKVGQKGQVIGVDFNDTMLNLARKYQPDLTGKIGYGNVRFAKGKIQDLALDLDKAQAWLAANPAKTVEDIHAYEAECARIRREEPMIESDSVDLVVSNCVLNLVRPEDKTQLFAEIFRVLNKGGRAVISDIVCDEEPTDAIRNDPKLWSGCISGAFQEHGFLKMFEQAGFHGVEILARQDEPWRVIDGVEFRSMTVRAFKGKQGACLERHQAVVYKGPWKCVHDDDGHAYYRGQRMAVCDKTFKLLTNPQSPYASDVIGLEPADAIPLDDANPFDCATHAIRNPQLTKTGYEATRTGDTPECCVPGSGESCC